MSKTKQDPDSVLKTMFELYLETKEAYDKHLFYKAWLRRYFIEN